MDSEIPTEVLAETENYSVWMSQEPDGEVQYHLEVGTGNVTIHFYQEEWDEFLELLKPLTGAKQPKK
ncbi:MAG TPA: hypothetical protein PLD47_08940 [Aggregatilineales bacterium]|nr:hypothetical protein [Anaerolineales bacterium]HRE47839.1 hypothetical protein [Aggregatilineales bacterium]